MRNTNQFFKKKYLDLIRNSKSIIWDFDGVLFDSLKECILVTKLASYLMKNNDLDLELHKIINPIEVEILYEKMKPLIF